jgi:hypothetical protein
MKIKHQLSIATLVMAGVFATGCSQQNAGGSQQVAGGAQVSGSQQQVEGGSQVSGSQQQVEAAAPVVVAPVVVAPVPAPVMAPKPPVNRWTHTHPAIPGCTNSIRHTHKFSNANHKHNYGCQGMRPAPQKPQVDVYALQRKLKAKGYYKGPIDGVVGPGTRDALQRFMKR